MKKLSPLVSIIFFTIAFQALGQNDFRNGYVITLERDTIQGEVDYRSNAKNYQSCLFKNSSGRTEYFPDQIVGFGYTNDKFFTSEIIDGWFVEALVIGDLSLYKFTKKYVLQKANETYEIEKKTIETQVNGVEEVRLDNRWRGVMSFLIGDCLQESQNIVNSLVFKEKQLTKLVSRYNTCKDNSYTVFKINKPWTKFNLGASLGITRSMIRIQNQSGSFSYLDKTYNSIEPSIAILMAISSPRITENVAFQMEMHFSKSNYSGLVEINGQSIEYHDTFIDLSTLSFPFSLKYSFKKNNYGFFLQGGLNYDFLLNPETRLLSERIEGNIVNTFPQTEAFEINSNQVGYWGRIGILKPYNKFIGSIGISYFQIPDLNKTEGFNANNSRISVNLILFKK